MTHTSGKFQESWGSLVHYKHLEVVSSLSEGSSDSSRSAEQKAEGMSGKQKKNNLPSDKSFWKFRLLSEDITHNRLGLLTLIRVVRRVPQVRLLILVTSFWQIGLETIQTVVFFPEVTPLMKTHSPYSSYQHFYRALLWVVGAWNALSIPCCYLTS